MRMTNGIQFRHELKYRISNGEKQIIKKRLDEVLKKDEHAVQGIYRIRSLYFDDFWNSAYEDKLSGIAVREKYRIRFYEYNDAHIKLECKHKQGNYIYKEAASLTREETERILQSDFSFLPERKEELCKRFYYQCTSRLLRPKVIVDYVREPYIYEAGDVRITFDSEIREAQFLGDLFDPYLPSHAVMDAGELIMEVKYTSFLPEFIRQIIPAGASDYTAASKYVMCYEKMKERY